MLFIVLQTLALATEDGVSSEVNPPAYPQEEKPEEKGDKKEEPKKDEKPPKEKKKKKEKKPKKEKSPKEVASMESSTMPYIIIGMETGAALNTTELKAGFLPQWHVGIQFPYWQDRLGVVLHGAYHVAKLEASGSSTTLTTGSYDYDIRQKEGEFGFNLRVRIPEVPVVTPEIWLGPTVQLTGTELQGKSGSAFPMTEEQTTRVGIHAALLGGYLLPVGQVFGGVHYTSYNFKTTIQGDVQSHSISPTIGYRYRFF